MRFGFLQPAREAESNLTLGIYSVKSCNGLLRFSHKQGGLEHVNKRCQPARKGSYESSHGNIFDFVRSNSCRKAHNEKLFSQKNLGLCSACMNPALREIGKIFTLRHGRSLLP